MNFLQIIVGILFLVTLILVLLRVFGQSPTSDQIAISLFASLYGALFDVYRRLGKQEEFIKNQDEHNKWVKEKLEEISNSLKKA